MEERVASVGDLADGQMMVVLVDGKKTLLSRVQGRFFATAARCPHWGAPLNDGLLNGPRLVCAWHKSIFDVRSGDVLEPPALDGIRAFHVRVDGDDVFVDREARPLDETPAPPQETAPDDRLFVVIGGGAAAAAALETLRQEGYGGRLVMISPEDRWPYDRPNLSKDFLTGELEAKWLPLRSPDFYEKLNVERFVGSVASLDVNTRELVLEDGRTLAPDGVLVASGARPRRLDVPGVDLGGIHTLRSWGDAEALVAAARTARRAVMIGASFIGMEVAAGLVKSGLDVTVVGVESVPFERVLGAEVGEVVQSVHLARGTRFALGRGVAFFGGEGRVEAVQLDNGTVLDTDLVVIGAGVEPVTDFVRGVERGRDGSLTVDEQLRVAPGVWAAGDVARYRELHTGRDVRIEHWRLAEQHGRAAARALAGHGAPFTGVPFFWTQQFDLRLGYVGAGQGWEELIVAGDLAARDFTAFYVAGEQVLAACGTRERELAAFAELMAVGALPVASALRSGGQEHLQEVLARTTGD